MRSGFSHLAPELNEHHGGRPLGKMGFVVHGIVESNNFGNLHVDMTFLRLLLMTNHGENQASVYCTCGFFKWDPNMTISAVGGVLKGPNHRLTA